MQKRSGDRRALSAFFRRCAEGAIGRRELLAKAVALAAGGATLAPSRAVAQPGRSGSSLDAPLALSAHGQFWLGVERIATAAGTIVNGEQRGNGHFMMVERNNLEALRPILNWLDATFG